MKANKASPAPDHVSNVSIIEVAFSEVLPFWKDYLWPNRKSRISPSSSMIYGGGNDMEIYRFPPIFLAAVIDDDIVGVNSGFQTGEGWYRSRGIWVRPDLVKSGVGRELMMRTFDEARTSRCHTVWSIPRQSAMPFYEACGFQRSSDWFDEGVEFGPNAYAFHRLEE